MNTEMSSTLLPGNPRIEKNATPFMSLIAWVFPLCVYNASRGALLALSYVLRWMLFKFTSPDIRQTTLVDCATGGAAYRTTTPHVQRLRSSSRATMKSFSKSQVNLVLDDQRTTFVEDKDGNVVAEITWEGNYASVIKIQDQVLQGTAELFDAAFIKILPDETLLPTRLEYVWRTTPDSLTLLDDDGEVIGELHPNCILGKDQLVPAKSPGAGHDYFQLDNVPSDEVLEIIVCYLLLSTLRERMYFITKHVYGQRRDPLAKLRRHATRSIAHLRQSFRRTVS
ncbi:hypothetical protein AcV5_006447 [Taiwanofungus camphoratus]|nr:hypothetical protein AcW2_004887 [Antrodia cinnamomea]KAI0934683.1 hypothetical protein AcV5_006447 [Antrodia cinnamomea]